MEPTSLHMAAAFFVRRPFVEEVDLRPLAQNLNSKGLNRIQLRTVVSASRALRCGVHRSELSSCSSANLGKAKCFLPSPGWRRFLERHAAEIWAYDFFCVQSVWFRALYAFIVVKHSSCEVLHVRVTEHPRRNGRRSRSWNAAAGIVSHQAF
jgi:hypothetical protein